MLHRQSILIVFRGSFPIFQRGIEGVIFGKKQGILDFFKYLFIIIFFTNTIVYAEIPPTTSTKTYQLPQGSFNTIALLLSQKIFTNIYTHYQLKFDSNTLKVERNYYDTQDLKLLKLNNSLYFQRVIKNNFKTIPLIIFSKAQQLSRYELRQKNKVISPEDKHPLLGKIKRSERKQLIEQLELSGIKELFSIRKILSLQTQTITHRLFYKRKHFANLSLDHHTADALGQDSNYLQLTIKLTPDFSRQNPPDIKQLRLDILSFLNTALKQKIIEDTSNTYTKAFNTLSQNSYFFEVFILYPVLFKLLQVIFFSILGALVLFLFFRKKI